MFTEKDIRAALHDHHPEPIDTGDDGITTLCSCAGSGWRSWDEDHFIAMLRKGAL